MATEQQPVNASTNSLSSNAGLPKKTGVRNAAFRHPSARGGQRYTNGEPNGAVPFVSTDALNFAPHLLATGFYPQQPAALFDYSVVSNPELGGWSPASDMQSLQLMSGAIYDPTFATGGYLSPTLVNHAAFTPVGPPTFPYETNELFNVCGMTPNASGVVDPNFPFGNPNLPPNNWDGFAATAAGEYPTWSIENGNQLDAASDAHLLLNSGTNTTDALPNGTSYHPSSPEVAPQNGSTDRVNSSNSKPICTDGESTNALASVSTTQTQIGTNRPVGSVPMVAAATTTTSGLQKQQAAVSSSSQSNPSSAVHATVISGTEQLTNQLSLLRVANQPTTAAATSTPSYASVLLSKVPFVGSTQNSNLGSSPGDTAFSAATKPTDVESVLQSQSVAVSSASALFKPTTTDDATPSSKGKLLSVAKRREITYASIVKAGTNDSHADVKSSTESATANSSTTTSNVPAVNGFGSMSAIQSSFASPYALSSLAQREHNGISGTPPWSTNDETPDILLEHLKATVNPAKFEVADGSRFFVIKSYSEDDVHRSIKYGIWCSTVHGNQKLDAAYRAVSALCNRNSGSLPHTESSPSNSTFANADSVSQSKTVVGLTYPINSASKVPTATQRQTEVNIKSRADAESSADSVQPGVYLFFSVNGSGHFCGMAQMVSAVDYETRAGVWEQDKWRGKLDVRWLYVKDVPNSALRNVRLENNENKPVTNSRDTQEVPIDKARLVLHVFATFPHTTSLFDDFLHYEQKQFEAAHAKVNSTAASAPTVAAPTGWNNVPRGTDWPVATSEWNVHASSDWQAKTHIDWNAHAHAHAHTAWAAAAIPQPNADWAAPAADWHAGTGINGDLHTDLNAVGSFPFEFVSSAPRWAS